jgi:hypothetical protein
MHACAHTCHQAQVPVISHDAAVPSELRVHVALGRGWVGSLVLGQAAVQIESGRPGTQFLGHTAFAGLLLLSFSEHTARAGVPTVGGEGEALHCECCVHG